MRTIIAFLALALAVAPACAQQRQLDSLLRVLERQPDPDTARMNTLIAIADAYATINYPKCLEHAREAWRIADALDHDRGRGDALMAEWLGHRMGWETDLADSIACLISKVADPVRSPRAYAFGLQWGHCDLGDMDSLVTEQLREKIGTAIRMFYQLGDSSDLAFALCGFGSASMYHTNGDSLDKGLAMAERIGDTRTYLEFAIYRIYYEPYSDDPELNARSSLKGMRIADSVGNLCSAVGDRLNLNYVALTRSDYNSAFTYLAEALPLAEAYGSQAMLGPLACNYAAALLDVGEYEEARSHYHRALSFDGRSATRHTIMTGLADVCLAQGKPDSALFWVEKAFAVYTSNLWDGPRADAWCVQAEAHVLKGEYTTAIKLWVKALPILESLAWFEATIVRADVKFGRALLAAPPEALRANGFNISTAYARADVLLHSGIEFGKEQGLLKEQAEALLGLSELMALRGDAPAALEFHQRYSEMRDSVLNDTKARSFALQHVRYETEKKEQQIVLLGKDKEVQAKEIQKQKVMRNAFMGGFALVALFAGVFFFQRNRISKARRRSDELLLNILPAEVAEELKAKGSAEAVHIDQVTVLFTDFKGFTAMSETLSPQELVRDLNECFSAFDHITEKYGIEKIKTIGDAYMAAGGLPTPNTTHATDVIRAAFEMNSTIAEAKARKVAAGQPYFEVRIGIHTGPVVAGIVGVKKFSYDIWGDTVNTASRMESSGEVGQVNISESTYALVKDEQGLSFTSRGKVEAKGKGEMEMYFVRNT